MEKDIELMNVPNLNRKGYGRWPVKIVMKKVIGLMNARIQMQQEPDLEETVEYNGDRS